MQQHQQIWWFFNFQVNYRKLSTVVVGRTNFLYILYSNTTLRTTVPRNNSRGNPTRKLQRENMFQVWRQTKKKKVKEIFLILFPNWRTNRHIHTYRRVDLIPGWAEKGSSVHVHGLGDINNIPPFVLHLWR